LSLLLGGEGLRRVATGYNTSSLSTDFAVPRNDAV
jgi:hypothetical protein